MPTGPDLRPAPGLRLPLRRARGRSTRRITGPVLVALAGFAGCVPGDRAAGGGGTLVVAPDDVRVVGTSDAIALIEDVMPAADGSAWVLNSTDPYLILLSAEGETLRVTGGRGGGPGELSWPSTLVRDGATGEVLVYDAALGRILPIDPPADGGRALTLTDPTGAPVRLNSYEYLWTNNGGRTWLEGTADGFVFAAPSGGTGWIYSLWSTDVLRLGRDGTAEPVLSTADLVGDPATRYPDATRFLPYPIWAVCPSGSFALYDPSGNRLRRFSPSGDEMGGHDLPPERRVEMSADRVLETVLPGVLRNRLMANPPEPDVLEEMFRRDYERRVDEFSDVFPEYVDLDCSGRDTLWLQRFAPDAGRMGRGDAWLRVSADGDQRPVEFPSSFRPLRFESDRIWGTYTGDFDVEYVAWTALVDMDE